MNWFAPLLISISLFGGGTICAQPLSGRAVITDADTFKLGTVDVRIWGIDAPERAQVCRDADGEDYRCGESATAALSAHLGSQIIRCEQVDRDVYGRTVARCFLRGNDVADWLVRNGWAVDYPEYSSGAYRVAEAYARQQRNGLWAGTFQPPVGFRRGTPPSEPIPTSSSGSCSIKGNINSGGERIYHVPGQRDYEATRIDQSKGERMFCTAEEAQNAGWRPAQR